MSVPYIFSNIPGGSNIPLAWLDDNFAYLSTSPTLTDLTLTGNLAVGGTSAFTGLATFNNIAINGVITIHGQSVNPTGVTGTDLMVFNTNPTLVNANLVTPKLGTPQSGDLANCTGLPLTSGVTGILPIANGGTSANNAHDALNNLLPAQTGNEDKFLMTDGAGNPSWQFALRDVINISALRALTPVQDEQVSVGGYYAYGDNGGGLFYGVTTGGPYTDNGGTIIVPGGGSGPSAWIRVFSDTINVKWFGAIGDGVTDDAVAINAAVSTMFSIGGGTVYIPQGTYLLGTTNVNNANNAHYIESKDGVSIIGDGVDVTILKVKSGENARFASYNSPNVIGTTQASPLLNCKFSDFTVDWNGSNNLLTSANTRRNNYSIGSGNGGAKNIVVQRIKIKGTPGNQCILFPASSRNTTNPQGNITISQCQFIDSGSGLVGNYNTDHSSIYCNGDNLLYEDNIFTATLLVTGSCYEIHGSYSSAINNYSYNYNRATWIAANYEGITDVLLDGNKHYGLVTSVDFDQTPSATPYFINNVNITNCVFSQRNYSSPNSCLYFINNLPGANKLANCNMIRIVNCEFLGAGNYPGLNSSFMNCDSVANLIFENNYVYNFPAIGMRLLGVDLGDGYVFHDYNIQNNVFSEVHYPFYCTATTGSGAASNLKIRSLLIQSNTFECAAPTGSAAILMYAASASGAVSNNNIINYSPEFLGSAPGLRVMLNIVNCIPIVNLLRIYYPIDGQNVDVGGYYSEGDGGGGQFYGVTGAATGTYVDNGGSIIVPTGGNGSAAWLRIPGENINVKWFGAKGDNATDDSAAIQAAINLAYAAKGGEVFFPAGRYVINTALKIQLTYAGNICIKLRGVSAGVATVSPASTGGSIIVGQTGGANLPANNGIMIDMSGGCNTIIEDLSLIAGTTNPSQIGIFLQRVSASGNGYCSNNKFVRVSIGMGSIPAANGGVGTIAIMNKRGEHHSHYDCWYYADTPIILDGNSAYGPLSANPIVSPFYAESFAGGATLGVNYFVQTLLIAASHNCVEAFSVNNLTLDSCYYSVRTGYCGLLIQFGQNIVMDATNIEYTGAIPTAADAFIRIIGTFSGLRINATSNIPNYTLIRTIGGARLSNADIATTNANFGAVFDKTTFAGGDLWGAVIKYDSSAGHSVPTSGIYNSTIMDVNASAAGAVQIDVRTLVAPTAVVSGYGALMSNTDGTDTITTSTTTYISELNITSSTTLSGATVLTGTVANGNAIIYLIDRAGAVVAQTASFAITGATFQLVGNNFTTAYFARGPGKYYVAVQCDNALGTNRIRTFPIGTFGASARAGTVFGTLANGAINAPSNFTANVGPIVSVY